MRSRWTGFQSPLADGIERFVAYKRTLRRRYDTEEKQLRLFDRFLSRQALTHPDEITPAVLNTFMNARSWRRPRSYNQMLGILRRLFDWLVTHEVLPHSPLAIAPRRETARRIPYLFTAADARRLLDLAWSLPDNPSAPRRGPTYRLVFALLYGLGLRVGEAARLRQSDIDFDRQLLVIHGTKFGKTRLVPFGPKLGTELRQYVALRADPLRAPDAPVFSFTRRGAIHPGTISYTRPALLVLDDFGLKALRPPGPEDLYDVINERYERASIILTSNRDRSEWPELFGEALLASAALDRLTHGAHFVEITGPSFRAEATKKQVTTRRARAAN